MKIIKFLIVSLLIDLIISIKMLKQKEEEVNQHSEEDEEEIHHSDEEIDDDSGHYNLNVSDSLSLDGYLTSSPNATIALNNDTSNNYVETIVRDIVPYPTSPAVAEHLQSSSSVAEHIKPSPASDSNFLRLSTFSSCLNVCGRKFNDCSCEKECEKDNSCCSNYLSCLQIQKLYSESEDLLYCEYSSSLDQSICSQCNKGFFFYKHTCLHRCPHKTHVNRQNKVCETKHCDSDAECEKCEDGYCFKCFRGSYLHEGKCGETCPDGTYADRESWRCKKRREHALYWVSPSKFSCRHKCNVEETTWDCSCTTKCLSRGNCCEDFKIECINIIEELHKNFTIHNDTKIAFHNQTKHFNETLHLHTRNHSEHTHIHVANKTHDKKLTVKGDFDFNILDEDTGDLLVNNLFNSIIKNTSINSTNHPRDKNSYNFNYIKGNKNVKFITKHIENINSNNKIKIYK